MSGRSEPGIFLDEILTFYLTLLDARPEALSLLFVNRNETCSHSRVFGAAWEYRPSDLRSCRPNMRPRPSPNRADARRSCVLQALLFKSRVRANETLLSIWVAEFRVSAMSGSETWRRFLEGKRASAWPCPRDFFTSRSQKRRRSFARPLQRARAEEPLHRNSARAVLT